jgi:hypothetical protein
MRRYAGFLGVALAAGVLAGCVERRYVVLSDPPGALVLRNDQPIGFTPADDHFLFYGDYHFTLIKEGYETLHVTQHIPAPWYEYLPLEFISENLVPWTIHDRREFKFTLEPKHMPNSEQLLNEAQNLRNRNESIAPPVPTLPPPTPLPANPPPP